MTDIGPTGYMTDGQIMAWLEQKSAEQYGNLSDQMGASNDRSTLIKNLTEAQAAVDGAKPDDAFDKLESTRKECNDPKTEAFIFTQQIALLGWTTQGHQKADDLDKEIDASTTLSLSDKETLKGKLNDARTLMDSRDTNAVTTDNTTMHERQQKDISGALTGETGDLGRIDSLALINIQQTVSDAKQTDQLASNILASRDQANLAIVGNIRG
jgi:hypothetical protein